MESVLVNIDSNDSKRDLNFFLNIVKRMGFKSKVLDKEDKEDRALLALMYERENEETVSVETTYRRLDNIIKK